MRSVVGGDGINQACIHRVAQGFGIVAALYRGIDLEAAGRKRCIIELRVEVEGCGFGSNTFGLRASGAEKALHFLRGAHMGNVQACVVPCGELYGTR